MASLYIDPPLHVAGVKQIGRMFSASIYRTFGAPYTLTHTFVLLSDFSVKRQHAVTALSVLIPLGGDKRLVQ